MISVNSPKEKMELFYRIKSRSREASPINNFKQVTKKTGSVIANGREPKSCVGRDFSSKLGCNDTRSNKCMACMQPLLELKTCLRVQP